MQVRAHAVEVLKRADDEELRYYLLPLVQALRYEPSDDSRLARFLVSRATADIALGVPLHWCVADLSHTDVLVRPLGQHMHASPGLCGCFELAHALSVRSRCWQVEC